MSWCTLTGGVCFCALGVLFQCSLVLLQAAVSMLKQEYKEGETDLKSALDLAIKVLSKTLDTTKLTHEKGK